MVDRLLSMALVALLADVVVKTGKWSGGIVLA